MPTKEIEEVDKLMDLLPNLSLRYAEVASADPSTLTDDDIATIIAYHRKNRANLAEGIKPKRGKATAGPKVKIDLAALGLLDKVRAVQAAAPTIKRRA